MLYAALGCGNLANASPEVRMNRSKRYLLAVFFIILSCCCNSHAQSGTTARNGRQLTCASDDGRRHFCAIDTRNGVRMTRQRSGSPCTQGSTWGYDRRGIWVDRGCRADFMVGVNRPVPPVNITCSSNDGRRHYCAANTSRGVRMVRQRSGSACVQGSSWGFDQRGIWVDRGCRADFTTNVAR